MQSITIKLPGAAYEILVGPGLLKDIHSRLRGAGLTGSFLLVSQPRIFKAVGHLIGGKFPSVLIPDGERAKTLATVQRLLNRMASLHLNRQSALIALGGGVVGDVSGFAASIYMRGIAVVQAPTSLLAQVDSSIGGKTGVNHRTSKNMIGTFHQPRLVLSDPAVFKTLPDREYASGLYEVLKYGIIRDERMFADFEKSIGSLLQRDSAAVARFVGRSVSVKAEVVMADEKEDGLRRILNLGHTVGHALEAASAYSGIKHGEAVGYGTIAAARISSEMGKLSNADRLRIEKAVLSIGRLPFLGKVKYKAVMNSIAHDKKVRDGAVHFVLPRAVGEVEITSQAPLELVGRVVKGILHDGTRR
jgi:3-dehydroquinate synthase